MDKIRIDRDRNSLVIYKDYFKRELFEFGTKDYQYNYRTKKREWVDNTYNIYTYEKKTGTYLIPIGMSTYLYNTNQDYPDELKDLLLNISLNHEKLITDTGRLRPDQQMALDALLKYKRGILSIYTGWGKTELAAVFIQNLINNADGNILVLGAKNMIIDELKDRFQSFGFYQPEYFSSKSRINVINPNGFCSSELFKSGVTDDWLKNVRFVLMDEVDRISNTAMQLLDYVERYGCDYFYGMSATADKQKARQIPATASLMSVMTYDLINVVAKFSHSVVHMKPTGFIIDAINVPMGKPDLSYLKDIENTDNAYEFIYGFTTSLPYMSFLRFVMRKCKPFIPMFYTTVIDKWIEYFVDKRIVILSGSGYQYYEDGKLVDDLTIEDLKFLVQIGDFDAIFTTVTGFSAIDLPSMMDVVLLSGTQASSVIQYIGRVSRKSEFRIWYATYSKIVPIYTRNLDEQLKLIDEYYDKCKLTHKIVEYEKY